MSHYYIHMILILLTVNTFSFAAFGVDKYLAIKHMWRISERDLLIISIIGCFGALAGQKFFNHKTKKFKGLFQSLIAIEIVLIVLYRLGYI